MKKSPLALGVALLLFAGWLTYLGVQALRDRRPVVVSRAQLAVSQYDVEVDLSDPWPPASPAQVKITNVRWPKEGDRPSGEIKVLNLDKTQGYAGPGTYILPLVRKGDGYEVAGLPPDPGYVPPRDPDTDKPVKPPLPRIYPQTPGVIEQWDQVRGQ